MQPDFAGPSDDAGSNWPASGSNRPAAGDSRLKIGVLVVAFNAESTLQATLDRIPQDIRAKIDEILIFDDASEDRTVDAGLAWREANAIPTTVIRHVSNLGYGGNQKAGYQLALEHGLDVIVLLHADGQYAPEAMADLLAPLERGEADAVFGSRMLEPGSARAGGMPLYKYLGNRVLTTFENRLLASKLSEFHSGYRAYRLSALAELPIGFNTDDFDFDTQIIIQLLDAGRRIVEVPIPTYYGDEICYVNGVKYARDVARDVLQYRLTKVGIGTHRWVPADPEYAAKEGEGTSHTVITEMLAAMPSGRVLDLGCSGGRLSERVRRLGHKVVGVDSMEIAGVRDRVDDFFLGDLEDGIPEAAGGDFDVVIAADVIEHVRYPERLLRQMAEVLSPTGQIVISTPNFGHWYSRGRVALGAFDYDRRGILDETHLRFFSRKSLRRTIGSAGLDILQLEYTGLPLEVLTRADSWKSRWARSVDRRLVRLRPTVFGYQFVARLRPHHAGSVTHVA
ncbi:MAG TPA: bifunctional glycosyltransferase/class I SAM-dependent methyltransferase [Jatrophihabitans sp.]|jgi:2-polyprenyl-3-methyl-5-hydroxy-6-metoxy-1,4-benzoquinol methylase|uniref:methyltransferase domain-containing protein n=1 Tax=Jatrophihabitans sp. TaxID=1932789 RepID=UPI002F13B68E